MNSADEPFIRDDDFVPDHDEAVDVVVARTGLSRDVVFRGLVAQDRCLWGMDLVELVTEGERVFAARCRAAAPDLFPATNVARHDVDQGLEATCVMRVARLSADEAEHVLTAYYDLILARDLPTTVGEGEFSAGPPAEGHALAETPVPLPSLVGESLASSLGAPGHELRPWPHVHGTDGLHVAAMRRG